ncbi:MAG: di-trans,poly-cis-decaprenylcistransferase [Oscillospiraceae bacterium]|nr:di-trans,poly-cis-decaprenylcistransferase [Oscillospiraceae bacterium]
MSLGESERIIPKHIGIIMDGNGRWAKLRGLPRSAGHRAGAVTFKEITRYANKIGVKCLTVYAFSSENWRRPEKEVKYIMSLFKSYLKDAVNYADENIKTRFIGDRSVLDKDLQDLMEYNENLSKDATGMVLNIAINYGGRQEILRAAERVLEKGLSLTEENLTANMDTENFSEVDLIIRPSGEERISNFLLWQSAYAELVFSDILWPDFKPEDLDAAIDEFSRRNRRFGGV